MINSCGRIGISVKILDKANTTSSAWINAGDLEMGASRPIYAPEAYGISSIKGIEVRSQSGSQISAFF